MATTESKLQAFENKCMRKTVQISYLEHKTNEYVWDRINSIAGRQETIITTIKRRKIARFGYVLRHDTLTKIILQGTIEGGWRRGRQRKSWLDNIKKWAGMKLHELLTDAQNRHMWRSLSVDVSMRSPRQPQRSRD